MNTTQTRRAFLRTLGASAALAPIAGCGGSRTSLTRSLEGKRPNFLFIVTDDQAPGSLKAYGNAVCETPNITRLAHQGITLDGAHIMGSWNGAVCMPSRHMIMSGRTIWHIPNPPPRKDRPPRPWDNPNEKHSNLVPSDLAQHTLPALFNHAGYSTFRTCKQGNSYPAANALFQVCYEKIKREATPGEGSDWHGDHAVEYLRAREQSADTRPFLMYLGFSHPHDTRNGKPDLLAKYGAHNTRKPPTEVNPKAPPLPVNYLPRHPFPDGHPRLRDEVAVPGVMESRSEATIRNELGRQYACIEFIDQQIGRVLSQLESMGELENTYVIFTGDNGIAVGSHGLMGKQSLYEHSWRVPFIMAGPGIRPGRRAAGNIYLLDVLATLCELAGIETPATNEGISFVPILAGKSDAVREVLYGVYCGGTKPGMRCVKEGDWKLIKYDVLDGTVRRTQLFNLKENPNELLDAHHDPAVVALTGNTPEPNQRNLADDPRYAAVRARLEAHLLAEQRRLNDPYRLWDQPGG